MIDRLFAVTWPLKYRQVKMMIINSTTIIINTILIVIFILLLVIMITLYFGSWCVVVIMIIIMIINHHAFQYGRDVSAVPVIGICWAVALVPTIPLWFGES